MKNIFLTLIMALLAATAIAQPPSAKLQKTVTTTIDTILTDIAPAAQMTSDSTVLLKIDELRQLTIEQHEKTTERIKTLRQHVQNATKSSYSMTTILRNMIPIAPFIAAICAIFFWLRYLYRRKLLRQDLIIRYIDRGEAVPEWLSRGESSAPTIATQANASNGEVNKANASSVKIFLVSSIILAAWTIIWTLALINSYTWREITLLLFVCGAFGYATIWCFQQYLKRTE